MTSTIDASHRVAYRRPPLDQETTAITARIEARADQERSAASQARTMMAVRPGA